MRDNANKNKIPLIDITQMTTDLYEIWVDVSSIKVVVQFSATTFPGQTTILEDHTHTNIEGVTFNSHTIAKSIKSIGNTGLEENILLPKK